MESSFQKKTTYWVLFYNIFFPLGACVGEFIDSQANYQGYKYDVHFLGCHTFAVINSVNGVRLNNNKRFWCVHFKARNDINVCDILLNDMIKNQEAVLYSDSPYISWGGISIKHLSKLLPLLQFTLCVVTYFVQLLNTLYDSLITLVQVLQISSNLF